MTTENEWVKIPDAVTVLKRGTVCKFASGTTPFVMVEDVEVHPHERETIQITKADERRLTQPDDLGDTPEHLKPLLRAAREIDPNALVYDDGTECPGVIPSRGIWFYAGKSDGEWSAAYIAQRIAEQEGVDRRYLKVHIKDGRCYPTADARRIGMEEFGMVFDGDPGTLRHTLASEEPHQACACGATTNLRDVVTQRKERRSQPTLTVYVTRCGACEQERRRAEVRADLDRKLPAKKPEKSLAPPTWPDGAGDDYEL